MAKELSGSLSKNKRKEKPSHPDLKGSCVIDGVAYWISGWKKEGDDGIWYSLAFKPKEADQKIHSAEPSAVDDLDSDLPF